MQTIIGVATNVISGLILAGIVAAITILWNIKDINAKLVTRMEVIAERVTANTKKLDEAIYSRYTSVDAAKDQNLMAEKIRALDARVTTLERTGPSK